MLKVMKKKQKTTGNKGFSLVELIVVIAIMAVLVAVLAPAMLKYVENSRKSTDASTVAGVVSTAQATIIDSNVAAGQYKITVNGGDGCKVTDAATNDEAKKIETALKDAYNDLSGVKLKSNAWKEDGVVVTITVQAGGATTITYASPGATGDDSFAKYIDATETPGSETPDTP